MKESRYTHYMRLFDLRTACQKKPGEVIFSTWFMKLVTCPDCKSKLKVKKK